MSYGDDGKSTHPKQPRIPYPEKEESAEPAGWLDALNLFLDRALKADIDTGC